MASNVELGRESFLDSQSSIPTQDRSSVAVSGTEFQPGSDSKDTVGKATLSAVQERLWCLDQFAAGKPINNVASVLEITGSFDVACLERAVGNYVQQYPILRTVVENREGRPCRRCAARWKSQIPVSNLTEFPESERERAAIRIAEAAAQDHFDIATESPLRLQVLRLGPEVHWLVITAHRMVLDEFSDREIASRPRRRLQRDSGGAPGIHRTQDCKSGKGLFAGWRYRILDAKTCGQNSRA
jgi:hypothetical protein